MKKIIAFLLLLSLLAAPAAFAEPQPSNASEPKNEAIAQQSSLASGALPKEYAFGPASTYALDQDTTAEFVQRVLAAWDAFASEIDVSDLALSVEEGAELYLATRNTFPRYFDVKGKIRYSYDPAKNTIIALYPEYACSKEEHAARLATYEAELARVLNDALPGNALQEMTPVEIALALHDSLALHAKYCHAALTDAENNPDAWNAYGLIVNKTAVCEGYALTYADLLRECGIYSQYATSETAAHAWNAVEVEDGVFYYVDVTWDDPSMESRDGDQDVSGFVRHTYFMLTREELLALDQKRADMVCAAQIASTPHPNQALWEDANAMFYYDGAWLRTEDAARYTNGFGSFTPYGVAFVRAALDNPAAETIYPAGNYPLRGMPARLGNTLYYGVIPQGGAEAGEIRAFNLEDGSERVVLTLSPGHCAEELEEKGGKIFYLDVWYDGGEQYVATCLRPAGDLNGDGATDLLDALALARHLAGQRSISAEDFAAAGVQAPNSVADVLNMLIAQKAA